MIDPRVLGHYRIESRLGSGRYALVYQALDTVRRRTVALKALTTEAFPVDITIARFLERARGAAELVHPHIAWIWEIGEADQIAYLAERYVNGPPLAAVLAESGLLTWGDALDVVQQVAHGLAFAHDKGWVHADVKPQNILLSPDLGAVLTDFGLMRALQSVKSPPGEGPLLGTAQYIPPEVWEGEPFGPAADQYALACVLVEALTGQALFEASTTLEIMSRHMDPLQLPVGWPEGVPWGIDGVMEQALARHPAGRYPNLDEFIAALDALDAEDSQGPGAVARRRAEASARQEAWEEARQQAEEAERLAALERARREIQEQLQRETQERFQAAEPLSLAVGVQESVSPGGPPDSASRRRRIRRQRPFWQRWWVWGSALVLIAALIGLWGSGNLPSGFLFLVTPSAPPPTATLTPTRKATPTPTAASTSTPTNTPTLTLTSTNTPTQTYTPTFTSTNTSEPAATLTPTSVPNERDSRISRPGENR